MWGGRRLKSSHFLEELGCGQQSESRGVQSHSATTPQHRRISPSLHRQPEQRIGQRGVGLWVSYEVMPSEGVQMGAWMRLICLPWQIPRLIKKKQIESFALKAEWKFTLRAPMAAGQLQKIFVVGFFFLSWSLPKQQWYSNNIDLANHFSMTFLSFPPYKLCFVIQAKLKLRWIGDVSITGQNELLLQTSQSTTIPTF